MKTRPCPAPWPRGFTLIEILIAIVVMAIGLLAVAAMQIQGVRLNLDSYARSQAVMLANDYVERTAANRPAAFSDPTDEDLPTYGIYDSDLVACDEPPDFDGDGTADYCGTQQVGGVSVAGTVCAEPWQMAAYDQYVVACGYPSGAGTGRSGGIRDLLQGGQMTVVCLDQDDAEIAPCPDGSRHRIDVRWVEQVKDENNRSVETAQTLSMRTRP